MKRPHPTPALCALTALCAFGSLALTGCGDPYDPTVRPDYTIRVVPTAQGYKAVEPACVDWANAADPFDNQSIPQFGCASQRNLAAMIENPKDLVEGRTLSNARGVTQVGAIRRYDNNQTRGLITPDSESSQIAVSTSAGASSTLTGDVTGGASVTPAAAAPVSQ